MTKRQAYQTAHGYKMVSRPFSIGAQPDGAVGYDESNRRETGYHGIVWYDRKLTADEIAQYELQEVA